MNVFERAARGKWRFPTVKGEVTAEQLFELPLDGPGGFSLNNTAIAIDDTLERSSRKNFIAPQGTDTARTELEGKLELVKQVIASKLSDLKAAETRVANAEKRRKVLDALASKENEELSGASKEELLAQLASIGN